VDDRHSAPQHSVLTFRKLAPVTVATRAMHLALENGSPDPGSTGGCTVPLAAAAAVSSRMETDAEPEVGAPSTPPSAGSRTEMALFSSILRSTVL